jgi:hypothetical protein
MSTLNEAGWRALNPRGPADASAASVLNASYLSTIPASVLATIDQSKMNLLLPVQLGMPIVESSNNVATGGSANLGSATSYASLTVTVGSGGTAGGVNVPRNLQYQMTFTNNSTQMVGATGTVVFSGTGLNGSTISESVAISDIASASNVGLQGTAIFSKVGANYTVNSWSVIADSASSKSITLVVGGGLRIGLPLSITATNAVAGAWIAGTNQSGTMTVITGGMNTAAIQFASANALDATDPVVASVWLTR